MNGGKKQLFKYRLKADQVLVTGESRDSKRKMQQPGLSVSTLSLPNTSTSQQDWHSLTLKERGRALVFRWGTPGHLLSNWVSCRGGRGSGRLFSSGAEGGVQRETGRRLPRESEGPLSSAKRPWGQRRPWATQPAASASRCPWCLAWPARRAPTHAPGLFVCPPAGFSAALAWPDRTVPSGKRRASGWMPGTRSGTETASR